MDIAKPKQQNRVNRRVLIGGAIAVVLVLLLSVFLQAKVQPKVELNKLLLGAVQRGDLQVTVDGYGILRSDKQTLITALTPATVAEVKLRPGAQVEDDSVILRLDNPALLQEVEAARIALVQEQANLRRIKLTNERELLNEQSALLELTATVEGLTLRREAEEGLVIKGIVPKVNFQTTLLQQRQSIERVQFQKKRIAQLRKVIGEAELIQDQQIKQVEAHFQVMQNQAERLIVRAGMKGVLQRLPVELGQSVLAGQELALVGTDKDLKALIRVSQAKAEQLQIGQSAQINTRRERVAGVVTRVTPEVRDGTIEVEVAFKDGVPASARPELNVDAVIYTSRLTNTLYVERPMNVQSHSKSRLFMTDANNKIADLQQVSFGADSGRFIQILSGAKESDRLILSDMSGFRDVEQIRIVQ